MSDDRDWEWATPADAAAAANDELLYGNVYVRVDEDGLGHRIDPGVVTPAAKPDPALVEIVGPGESMGGERGHWRIVHKAGEDARAVCGRGFRSLANPRHAELGPLILEVECPSCAKGEHHSQAEPMPGLSFVEVRVRG